MNGKQFQSRFIKLILLSWLFPPVVGLGFILFTGILSGEQMLIILTTPLEPAYIIITLILAIYYFKYFIRPFIAYLDSGDAKQDFEAGAINCIRSFPLHFWGIFIAYLVIAPASVIYSAETYSDYVAQPIDWFRIQLVALTVSIIVGLPIFFRIFDLFGEVIGDLNLTKPFLTIKTKVFLIGALIPLLIDTMIVQYYWTRTGYFTMETFSVWLLLELIAIAGSLLFTHSFGQALLPLHRMGQLTAAKVIDPQEFTARSTDELGLIVRKYSDLLLDLKNHTEILSINRESILDSGYDKKISMISDKVINLCKESLKADITFLILFKDGRLTGVADSNNKYNPDGYYYLSTDENSAAVKSFNDRKTQIINDAVNSPDVNSVLQKRFHILSCLATPLDVEDKVIGVLMCAFQEYRHIFPQREINLFESIAHEAALVINTQIIYEEKAEIERESKKTNEYIHTMFNATSEGILSIDPNMKCTFMNTAAINMLGYTPYELYDKNIYEVIHHSDQHGNKIEIDDCAIYRSMADCKSMYSDKEVFKTKAGDAFPVQFSSTPIYEDNQVIGAVVVFRNVAAEKAIENKLNYLATHDSLTSLINRHEFEARLSQLIDESKIDNTQHALCYLDLDQFKIVNDTCGHIAGDELLRQISTLLKSHIRQGDTLGRLGGDEFGVLFPHCNQEKVLQLSEDLRKTIEDFRFSWEGKNFTIGVSIGVVPIDKMTESLHSVLSAADAACYLAKDSGRNRIHVYHESDSKVAQHYGEMHWVNRINSALEQNQFVLYFQPITSFHNIHNLHSFIEILVKIKIDDTLIPPGAFIPAAERYNLMPLIDKWVLKQTFKWLKQNSKLVSKLDTCSINLSGASIGDQTFMSFIIDQLESGQVPINKICFEITETTAVSNLSQALHFIQELKKRGCRFALDDFGSGMSSFSYLKTLPVDFVKIDGNFVRNIAEDHIDRTMVDAINQVGRAMNISTIAEYVENQRTLDELRKIGIDFVQGYGICEPQPLYRYGIDKC
ncbi:MAG: EAL domain-containing protein [Gammaproteobacteria bacterium]